MVPKNLINRVRVWVDTPGSDINLGKDLLNNVRSHLDSDPSYEDYEVLKGLERQLKAELVHRGVMPDETDNGIEWDRPGDHPTDEI